MAAALSIGDRVSWDTSQGRTRGKVVARKVKPFTFAGQRFVAHEDDPRFVVESEKTGERAAHTRAALRRLST